MTRDTDTRTIPRRFYPKARAHHAMCMGIDHGMLFEIMIEGDTRTVKPEDWRFQRLDLANRFDFYIHPDSLCLLEPVTGDMVTNIGMSGWRVTRVDGDRVYCAHDYFGRKGEMSIIQRDGLPFFWPEVEA